MMQLNTTPIRAAHVPMACTELVPTMDFFVQRLGFRIDAIFPADAPATAILSGHGLTLHLSRHVTEGVPAAPRRG